MQLHGRRLLLPLALLLVTAAALGQDHQFERAPSRPTHLYLEGGVTAFTVGDVDADGELEFITAHQNPFPPSIWIMLLDPQPGGGTATQLSGVPLTPAVATPIDLELLDLDGDGDLDLLMVVSDVVNQNKTVLRFFRNDGAGALTDVYSIHLPGFARVSFDADDYDGDGDIDVVLSTRTPAGQGSPLSLYKQVGPFSFSLQTNSMPGTVASDPEFADIDGDGDRDIAAIGDAGALLAFTNDNGTFHDAVLDAGPFAFVIGDDLDGDGDDDLLVQRSDGSIERLLATAGSFTSTTVLTAHTYPYRRPKFVDLDGDNDLDAIIHVDSMLNVLRNDGLADFVVEPVVPCEFAEPADLDDDGMLDLLLMVPGGLTPAYSRPAGMAFDPALLRPSNAVLQGGHLVGTADFNGDFATDLLHIGSNSVYVHQNLGCGEWRKFHIRSQVVNPGPRVADIDGDGDEDIVMTSSNVGGAVGLQVMRNDGDFVFEPLPTQPLPSGSLVGEGDFDGDGRTDLLFTDGGSLQLLRGTSDCVFASATTLYSGNADYSRPGLLDIDGDQDLDILMTQTLGCVLLLSNDGAGNFTLTDPCVVDLPSVADNLTMVDIDGDGDLDIFGSGYGEGQLWINDGGTFTAGQELDGVEASSLLFPHFADWDGDGDMDMLQTGGTEQLWLQDDNGVFTDEAGARFGAGGAGTRAAADLDGDGDIDPIPIFGFSTFAWTNHQRSARSLQIPTIGGEMRVQFAHEPGYATEAAICIPILSLARRSTPLPVPGFEGLLQIDLLQSALLPHLVLAAPNYTAESTFAIPVLAGLLGIDLYAQGLLLTEVAAWTPAVHERIF